MVLNQGPLKQILSLHGTTWLSDSGVAKRIAFVDLTFFAESSSCSTFLSNLDRGLSLLFPLVTKGLLIPAQPYRKRNEISSHK